FRVRWVRPEPRKDHRHATADRLARRVGAAGAGENDWRLARRLPLRHLCALQEQLAGHAVERYPRPHQAVLGIGELDAGHTKTALKFGRAHGPASDVGL